jgi:hypothetical protein
MLVESIIETEESASTRVWREHRIRRGNPARRAGEVSLASVNRQPRLDRRGLLD